MEGYITIAVFSSEVDAQLAQATLAAAGIDSYLKFEDTGHMLPSLQQSEGVELQVDPSNQEEASILLSNPATNLDDPSMKS